MTLEHLATTERSDVRTLGAFAALAVPTGWVLLSIPLLADLPVEPFVLGTLVLGLVVPAVVLTRGEAGRSGALWRDCFRLPNPRTLLLPALLLVPVGTVTLAVLWGEQAEITASSVLALAIGNVASSLLIVNLWEEMVWAGFVQRRATNQWGFLGGSLLTALLFVAIHLPLALYDVHSTLDVLDNLARMVVAGVGLRLLIGAFDEWGQGSILVLAMIHATFNASAELVDPDHDWLRYLATLGLGVIAMVARGANPTGPTYEEDHR
jgi:membrane protease YdiL (CAAX protease family)